MNNAVPNTVGTLFSIGLRILDDNSTMRRYLRNLFFNFLMLSAIISALLYETPAAIPRQGNQTLVNIAQMKGKPIASDSSLLKLKLILDQGRKCTIKQTKYFVMKLRFSWRKKINYRL